MNIAEALNMATKVGSIVSSEYAALDHPSDYEIGSMIDNDLLMGQLPTRGQLQLRLAKAIRRSTGVEVMDAGPMRRTWLMSDLSGPGYVRQKMYAKLFADNDTTLAAHAGNWDATKALEIEVSRVIDGLSIAIRGAVSTFRAYHNLTDRDVVVVRGLQGSFPAYLMKRDQERVVRVDPMMDQLYVIVGAYFTVTPPGAVSEQAQGTDEAAS